MPPHILRFTSPSLAFELSAECSPHADTIDGWTISELVRLHPKPELAKDNIQEYYLVLEKSVASPDDLRIAFREAMAIAHELEYAWCYATGRPLHYIKLRVRPSVAPEGWTGNYEELRIKLDQEAQSGFALVVQWRDRAWATTPILPLKLALDARRAILHAPPVLRQLIEIHVDAFKNFGQPRFILLAKALEIVGAYYVTGVGRCRKNRNIGLQNEMTSIGLDTQLTKTVAWLFEMSNTRREIRHAWDHKKTASVALHPSLSDQEQLEFAKNADLVVRAFICQRLSIPRVTRVSNTGH
jgi:hypothetical protein